MEEINQLLDDLGREPRLFRSEWLKNGTLVSQAAVSPLVVAAGPVSRIRWAVVKKHKELRKTRTVKDGNFASVGRICVTPASQFVIEVAQIFKRSSF